MKSKVREPAPPARFAVGVRPRRVGGDARDLELLHQPIGATPEPARVSRLQRDSACKSFAQNGEEAARDTRVEGQAGRQLHQQAAQSLSQRREILEKRIEKRRGANQPLVMRDSPRHLDGEPEGRWHARGPTLESRGSMRAM